MKKLIWLLLLQSSIMLAQRPGAPGGRPLPGQGSGGRPSAGELLSDFVDTDSISVPYWYKETNWDTLQRADTTLHDFYHVYDVSRRREWDYLHTGLAGSPTRPVYYQANYIEGNRLGMDVLDLYKRPAHQTPFFETNKPFSDLIFLRGADQDDYNFEAIFAHTFGNGLQFTLDYQRMGTLGEYANQRLRNTSFSAGLHYTWWDGKVNSYLSFSNSAFLHENNGGITTDDNFQDPAFNLRIGYPVFLDNSRTRYTDAEVELYNVVKAPFTTRYPITLYHSFRYNAEYFKFYEIGQNFDPDYFGLFLTDFRSIRHASRLTTYRNEVGLEWAVTSVPGVEIDRLRGGLVQRQLIWEQEPLTTRLSELHLFAEGYLTLFDRIKTKARYAQGTLDAAGNSQILVDGTVELGKGLLFKGKYERNSIIAGLMQQSINVNFQNVFTADLDVQRFNALGGGIELPQLGSSIEATLIRALDIVVFNLEGLPEQLNDPTNILQIAAIQKLKFWHINWNNYFLLQVTNENKLGLPTWFYKTSLFFEKEMFRGKTPVRIGADFRVMPDFFSLTYLPLQAQFAYQNESEQQFFPEVDVYLGMKVKVFRAFVRFENLIGLVNNVPLIHHYRYPMHESRLTLGIHWILPN